MFSGAGPQNETVEKLLASAKGYVALMQSMVGTAAGPMGADGSIRTWTDAMRGGMNLPGMEAALVNNPMARALREITGQGAKGFEQMMAGLAPFTAPFKQEAMSWMRAPAFGYLREHQEHYQKMTLAFAEYQDAMNRYNTLILKSSQRSFEILEDKLIERSEPGRQIDSARAFYDLWVDAAEEAYAEIALSEEFRKVYGDVVNAQMRVRSHIQQEAERIGAEVGMPTRTELNTVHKRLHDLRRELKQRDESAGASDLAHQVAQLRAEIAALKKQQESTSKQATHSRASGAQSAKTSKASKH